MGQTEGTQVTGRHAESMLLPSGQAIPPQGNGSSVSRTNTEAPSQGFRAMAYAGSHGLRATSIPTVGRVQAGTREAEGLRAMAHRKAPESEVQRSSGEAWL